MKKNINEKANSDLKRYLIKFIIKCIVANEINVTLIPI